MRVTTGLLGANLLSAPTAMVDQQQVAGKLSYL